MSDNMPEKTIVAEESDFFRKSMSRRNVLKAFSAIFSGIAASAIAGKSWPAQEGAKMLVIYFSHSGNTRSVAREIQTFTNAQMVEIKPVKPFPTNYDALVNLEDYSHSLDAVRVPARCQTSKLERATFALKPLFFFDFSIFDDFRAFTFGTGKFFVYGQIEARSVPVPLLI